MAAKFPTGLPTADDWSTSNAGMGRTKVNGKSVNDKDKNYIAEEYNQQNLEIIALAKKVGADQSTLPDYGDDELGSMDETLRWNSFRWDRASIIDHGCYATSLFSALNTADSGTSVTGGTGVRQIICGVGLREGWAPTGYKFYQRQTRFRCRWRINGIPAGVADTMEVGLEDGAGHFVKFHVTNPSNPTVWTVEINNGGVGASDTLTVSPAIDTWYDFEIHTTSSGATFWYQRGTASQQKKTLVAAPFNGVCRPVFAVTSAAGGEFMFYDMMGAADTSAL